MGELVDFITSLEGYAFADGWPSYLGLQGPDYQAWLVKQPGAVALRYQPSRVPG